MIERSDTRIEPNDDWNAENKRKHPGRIDDPDADVRDHLLFGKRDS